MTEAIELGLPAQAFDRKDDGDDLGFYAPPRLVTHIDEAAVDALTSLYREAIPAGGRVLDLMSSWVSHLPDDVAYAEVVGHGMNAEELAANPRLDRWFVQNLNDVPRCLIPRFDGAILSLEWKEAIWDRYVTGAPRPRTPSEQQYSDRKLRSRR